MKKNGKVILIMLGVLIGILLIDTIQAKLLNHKPILKIVEYYNGGDLYQKDKGIFVDTYSCTNGTKKTVFKWEKYNCSMEESKNDEIPNDYIVVFHGGSGEIVYETYIYKINNGQSNYGFRYINVTKMTTSWGSSNWNTKVTKRGSVNWTENVFEVAEKNNAYSYVTLPNNDKTYTIEEFKPMFLLN